jgi:hypothetical protein
MSPMSTGRQAPEIYAKPLSEFSGPGYPPVGTPEHEQTVVTTISLGYAAMGVSVQRPHLWRRRITLDC